MSQAHSNNTLLPNPPIFKKLHRGYRYHFNGKSFDNEISGWQDYGERMYNTLTGRFPTADPLIVKGQQYPELSPYQFASNRPIDGIDLDGLEFSKTSSIDPVTGVTTVTINVKINILDGSDILDEQAFNSLVKTIQTQFSSIVGNIYNEKTKTRYLGNIEFSDDATLFFGIYDAAIPDNPAAGASSGGSGYANTGDRSTDGSYSLYTNRLIATNVIEEIFHMGGVQHPPDPTNTASDAKTIWEGGKNFKTTPNTLIPQIYWNVMQYGFQNIDNKNVNSVRGSNENRNIITPDQIKIVEQNIDLNCVNGEPNLE